MNTLPTLGVAFRLEKLTELKDWVLERHRDVEIQDPTFAFQIGEWKDKAIHWNRTMSDYQGRLGVHGPYDGVAIASRDPDAQQFAQKKLLDCLDFCAEIGASHCVVHSPFHFLGSSAACHTPTFGLEPLLENAKATLDPILARAESINCCLVIENIFDRHTAPLRELVNSFNSPFLKRSVDTGHARIAEKTAAGPSPEFWILEAAADLAHIHLQDTNGENDYHWTPGRGDINWEGVFAAIAKTASEPRLIIEVKDILAAWNYFKKLELAV